MDLNADGFSDLAFARNDNEWWYADVDGDSHVELGPVDGWTDLEDAWWTIQALADDALVPVYPDSGDAIFVLAGGASTL